MVNPSQRTMLLDKLLVFLGHFTSFIGQNVVKTTRHWVTPLVRKTPIYPDSQILSVKYLGFYIP